MDIPHKIYCPVCGYYFYHAAKEYMDKWGNIWRRENNNLIIRISDGNVGRWFEGKRLTLIDFNQIQKL